MRRHLLACMFLPSALVALTHAFQARIPVTSLVAGLCALALLATGIPVMARRFRVMDEIRGVHDGDRWAGGFATLVVCVAIGVACAAATSGALR